MDISHGDVSNWSDVWNTCFDVGEVIDRFSAHEPVGLPQYDDMFENLYVKIKLRFDHHSRSSLCRYRRRELKALGNKLRQSKYFKAWQEVECVVFVCGEHALTLACGGQVWHQGALTRKLVCLRAFRKWVIVWVEQSRLQRRNGLLGGEAFRKLPLVRAGCQRLQLHLPPFNFTCQQQSLLSTFCHQIRATAFYTWRLTLMQAALAQVSLKR